MRVLEVKNWPLARAQYASGLKHLQTLKGNDPEKYRRLYAELEKKLAKI